MKNEPQPRTTSSKVCIYAVTYPLLLALMKELERLSVKKPDAILSKTKVATVNRLLRDMRELLKDEDSHKYLDLLNDEELPQYSDATIVLSQYEAAMNAFRRRYQVRVDQEKDEWGIALDPTYEWLTE